MWSGVRVLPVEQGKGGVYRSKCVQQQTSFSSRDAVREVVDAERVSIECERRGQSRPVLNSEIERGEGRFCGRECHSEWMSENRLGEEHHHWRPGETGYAGEWWSVRGTTLGRDDHQYQRYKWTGDEVGRETDVHHVTPVREFEDTQDAHVIETVVTLCRSC